MGIIAKKDMPEDEPKDYVMYAIGDKIDEMFDLINTKFSNSVEKVPITNLNSSPLIFSTKEKEEAYKKHQSELHGAILFNNHIGWSSNTISSVENQIGVSLTPFREAYLTDKQIEFDVWVYTRKVIKESKTKKKLSDGFELSSMMSVQHVSFKAEKPNIEIFDSDCMQGSFDTISPSEVAKRISNQLVKCVKDKLKKKV